jgi:hypothetical protein
MKRFCSLLAGPVLALTFFVQIANSLIGSKTLVWGGAGYWIAAALIAFSQPLKRKLLSQFLLITGVLTLGLASARGASIDLAKLASANSQIIAMIISASLLPLLPSALPGTDQGLPRGRSAIIKTLLASHFLGSILNLSAVFLLGDRLAGYRKLDDRQAIVLTRSFAAAGLWSPFFITMAVALQYAPGANLVVLWTSGIAMALCSLFFTYLEVHAMPAATSFVGYAMNPGALGIPLALVLGVLTLHAVAPAYSPLNAIALLTLLSVLLYLCMRPRVVIPKLGLVIVNKLPQTGSELILFLSAGVFSLGCALLLATIPAWHPFSEFGFWEATASFISVILLAQIGIHPVASITFIGTIVASLSPPPLLAASVFLYAWALSSAISPLSSQNLSTFARYDIDGKKIHIRNLRYGLIMSILMIGSFFLFSR